LTQTKKSGMRQNNNRISILVVDDEEDLCWAFETMFKSDGFIVDTVKSGEKALDTVQNREYSIIILDTKLPGIDGFKTSRILKKLCPHTKIIMFSGYYDQEDKEIQEGIKQGLFQEFLEKPFDFEQVSKSIIRLLKVNNTGGVS